jgi:TrmH family RNA methyltransferase
MMQPDKLARLSPGHRLRKAALILGDVERAILSGTPTGGFANTINQARYAIELAAVLAADKDASQSLRSLAEHVVSAADVSVCDTTSPDRSFLRAIDSLRHALLAASGQAAADWDLIDPATGRPDSAVRRVRSGTRAYLEDLRSPFNVGSVFRTADALGLAEIFLSPQSADPGHPRAERSAMGAVGLVPWQRSDLEALREFGPAFALELGGTPIGEFEFPARGIAVLGSEELGVSNEALELCPLGKVSIPMSGAKGSLNVSVAFGILMYAWTQALARLDP